MPKTIKLQKRRKKDRLIIVRLYPKIILPKEYAERYGTFRDPIVSRSFQSENYYMEIRCPHCGQLITEILADQRNCPYCKGRIRNYPSLYGLYHNKNIHLVTYDSVVYGLNYIPVPKLSDTAIQLIRNYLINDNSKSWDVLDLKKEFLKDRKRYSLRSYAQALYIKNILKDHTIDVVDDWEKILELVKKSRMFIDSIETCKMVPYSNEPKDKWSIEKISEHGNLTKHRVELINKNFETDERKKYLNE